MSLQGAQEVAHWKTLQLLSMSLGCFICCNSLFSIWCPSPSSVCLSLRVAVRKRATCTRSRLFSAGPAAVQLHLLQHLPLNFLCNGRKRPLYFGVSLKSHLLDQAPFHRQSPPQYCSSTIPLILLLLQLHLLQPFPPIPSHFPLPSFRSGRKKASILYCITYILSCWTKHSSSFAMLMVGRILGGIATSLLFSAFESWLVAEHFKVREICLPCG